MKLTCFWLALFSFVLSSVALSQNSEVGPQVRLVPVNGKTVYRIGEPIYLSLVFNSQGGEYYLLMSSEQMVSTPDEVILTPIEVVFDWRARYERGKYFMNDYFGYTKLSEKPINVDLALNDFFRFDRPGKYSVYVKTKRVFAEKTTTFSPNLRDLLPLVSNPVDFEIKEMTDAEERAEIKRLTLLIDSETDWQKQDKFARELAFLAGDAATVEKIKRFLNPGEYKGNYHHHISKGLLMARNKELAIKLLEEAFRDLDREVGYNLPYMLGELRRLAENSGAPSIAENGTSKPTTYVADKRSSEIRQAYFDEMLRSLPFRKGKSRLVTAFTIFTQLPNTDVTSEAFTVTKAILLEDFDALTPHGKDQLLGHFWEKIKTPVLLPSIEKILQSGEPVSYWSYRNLALKRLMEFDQKKARSLIIEEIRNPDSRISVEVLVSLKDRFLPEINHPLLEQIRKLAPTKDIRLGQKIILAARYADKTIYQALREIYSTHGKQWLQETRSGLLAYFIRHDDIDGTALIEENLVESGDKSGSGIFFTLARTDFPDLPNGLEKLWRKRLEDDDPEVAGTAAYYLSRYGRQGNKELIEKRHYRWLKKWAARAEELNKPDADPKIAAEAMLQVNLIDSLIGGKNWKLTTTELARVKSLCIARTCRSHFQVH